MTDLFKQLDESQEISENHEHIIRFEENEKGFDASFAFKQELLDRVRSTKLSLKKENIFNTGSFLNKLCKRKNEIFYFVNTCEMHVDIKDTQGKVYLPLITSSEISKNLLKIDSKIRSKINVLHLGAVKILLKAEFQHGINSPIKMALIDNRINDRNDCILGAAKGNLAYGKFMFTVHPKFGLDIKTKNLNQVLSFIHQFERSDLMNTGDKVFSITYLVGYALTNSHHSIDYKHKEYIELEDVFSDIGTVQSRQFCEIEQDDNSWAIDIAKGKPALGETSKVKSVGSTLKYSSPQETITLGKISRKIDSLETSLAGLR